MIEIQKIGGTPAPLIVLWGVSHEWVKYPKRQMTESEIDSFCSMQTLQRARERRDSKGQRTNHEQSSPNAQ